MFTFALLVVIGLFVTPVPDVIVDHKSSHVILVKKEKRPLMIVEKDLSGNIYLKQKIKNHERRGFFMPENKKRGL